MAGAGSTLSLTERNKCKTGILSLCIRRIGEYVRLNFPGNFIFPSSHQSLLHYFQVFSSPPLSSYPCAWVYCLNLDATHVLRLLQIQEIRRSSFSNFFRLDLLLLCTPLSHLLLLSVWFFFSVTVQIKPYKKGIHQGIQQSNKP